MAGLPAGTENWVVMLEFVLGLVAFLFVILIERPKPGTREHALVNRKDTEVHELEQLPDLCRLAGPGPFIVRTLRQSGNFHQDDRMVDSAAAALKLGMATFRRARIDLVVVMDNRPELFSFRRVLHDHRGRAEGKKVGWIEIARTASSLHDAAFKPRGPQ